MVEPTIRLEESTAPGRTHDLDVYAEDVRLGSIRPVDEGGFVGWRWHFGAALADPALELGRVCEGYPSPQASVPVIRSTKPQ
ncbi:MAG: hypothetical protein F4Y25_06140, partial [Chloroflexi bacterium]|nr:hypothetical protein [Chloroflexota bacterium]